VTGQRAAAVALRPSLEALLVLNAITLGLVILDVRATLARAYDSAMLVVFGFLVLGGGLLAPLYFVAVGGPVGATAALLLILLVALLVRRILVRLPHLLGQPPGLGL
jgi:hypothetical protein